jgi:hypothetical protein
MKIEYTSAALAAGCGAVLLALAGCASAPPPNDHIAVAKASVSRAEQAGAPQLAPVELQTARDKLARADKAAVDGQPVPAAELADQANVDAQLAEATADTQRSHKAAMEFEASMQALRNASAPGSNSPN